MASAAHINVAVRVRPLSERETTSAPATSAMGWRVGQKSLTQVDATSGAAIAAQTYAFDRVFGPATRTADVYRAMCEDIVRGALDGINGTVFAYGQTSSGKTHTMRGTAAEPGVVGLATQQVFAAIKAASAADREYLLRVSYMEIYNERVRDLLSCSDAALALFEDAKRGGCYVAELHEEVVTSEDQVEALLEEGEQRRHVARTAMNDDSSRSHTIVRIVVECSHSAGVVRVGTLNLVDLAGSERLKSTKAEGQRAKEGAAINKSLLTLGNVIRKLSAGTRGEHVPYRDAVLTRILQGSLGGNCRAAIICTISPAQQWAEETLSTLKFASQAKMVTNQVKVNEVVDEAALLQRYRATIQELSSEVERLRAGAGAGDGAAQLQARLAQREDELQHLRSLIVTGRGHSAAAAAAAKSVARRETWCAGQDGNLSFISAVAGDDRQLAAQLAKRIDGDDAGAGPDAAAAAAAARRVTELEQRVADAAELQEALEEENRLLDTRLKEAALRGEGAAHELQQARDRVAHLVETLQLAEDAMVDLRREAALGRAQEAQCEAARREGEQLRRQLEAGAQQVAQLEERALRADELELEAQALRWERGRAAEQLQQAHAELEAAHARAAQLEAAAARLHATGAREAELAEALARLQAERDGLAHRLRVQAEAAQLDEASAETRVQGLQSTYRNVESVRERIKQLGGDSEAEGGGGGGAEPEQQQQALRRRCEALQAHNVELRAALAAAQTLQGELDAHRLSSSTHRVVSDRMEARLERAEHALQQAQQQVQQLQAELATVHAQKDAAADKARQRVQTLEAEIQDLEEEVDLLTSHGKKRDLEASTLRDELQLTTDEVQELRRRLRARESEATHEQQRLADAQREAAEQRAKAGQQAERVAALEAEAAQARRRVDGAHDDAQRDKAALRAHEQELALLRQDAARHGEEAQRHKAEAAQLQREMAELRPRLRGAEDAAASQSRELELAQRQLQELRSSSANAGKAVDSLRAAMKLREDALTKEAAELRTRAKAVEAELAHHTAEAGARRQAADEATQEVAQLRAAAKAREDALAKEAAAAKAREEALAKEVAELKGRVRQRDADGAKQAAEAKRAQGTVQERAEGLERELRLARLDAERLRADSQEARVARERDAAELKRLQDEAAAKDKKHAEELFHKDKKLAQLKELAMEKAKEKLRERDAVIRRLEKDRARLEQERDADLERADREHQQEREALQGQIAELRALLLKQSSVENSPADAGKPQPRAKKDNLLKLHSNFG